MRDSLILKPTDETSTSDAHTTPTTSFPLRRWVHVALIHHNSRSSNNVRLFLDGMLYASAYSPYPKSSVPPISFFLGNEPRKSNTADLATQPSSSTASRRITSLFSSSPQSSPVPSPDIPLPPESTLQPPVNGALHIRGTSNPIWFLSSAHLILHALPNSIPRVVHTLGHRYAGNFQDTLARFLTYKASTSLNVALSQRAMPSREDVATLTKALRSGIDVKEDRMAFSLNASATVEDSGTAGVVLLCNTVRERDSMERAKLIGEVRPMQLETLESALWNAGGAPVLLRLVELAEVSLSVSWQTPPF